LIRLSFAGGSGNWFAEDKASGFPTFGLRKAAHFSAPSPCELAHDAGWIRPLARLMMILCQLLSACSENAAQLIELMQEMEKDRGGAKLAFPARIA